MARLCATSSMTGGLSTFFVLLIWIFQAFSFYQKTHAFLPSLPTSIFINTPYYCTSQKIVSSRYKAAIIGGENGEDNATGNPGIPNSTEQQEEAMVTSLPIRYDTSRIRFRCRISYDGTSFAGFQLQGGRGGSGATKPDTTSSRSGNISESSTVSTTITTTAAEAAAAKNKEKQKRKQKNIDKSNNPRTIQGELEQVLSVRFQRLVKVVGAGRTDGGVHARGQAIHFDLYHNETNANANSTSADFSFERDLEITMNRMLPSDIRAWNLGKAIPTVVTDTGRDRVPHGLYNWNAMRSCDSKLYSYRICIGNAMNPSDRHHRWQLPWPAGEMTMPTTVDPDRLERILKKFEGDHDFVCFAGALEQQEKKTGIAISTVRTIHKVLLVKEAHANVNANHDDMGGDPSQHYYRIDIYLDGALYKMVRNIVGTSIDVCREWLDEETFSDLLNRPSELKYTRKNNPSKPAPSNGLTLERVFYPDDF